MGELDLNTVPPRRALMMIRIIWFALIFGQIAFLGVLALIILPNQRGPRPQPMPILVWVNVGMLVTIVPAMFVIRAAIFRRGEVAGSGIRASAYSTGNIVFWAACEGVSMFGLVIAMINGSLWPTLVIVVIALSLQAITFPVGGQLYIPTAPAKGLS